MHVYACEPMRVLALLARCSSISVCAARLPLWEVFPLSPSVSVSLSGMVTTWNCSSHFPASAATNTTLRGQKKWPPLSLFLSLSLSHTYMHTRVLSKKSHPQRHSQSPPSWHLIPPSLDLSVSPFNQLFSYTYSSRRDSNCSGWTEWGKGRSDERFGVRWVWMIETGRGTRCNSKGEKGGKANSIFHFSSWRRHVLGIWRGHCNHSLYRWTAKCIPYA